MANSSKDPGAISLVRADHVEARRKRRLSRGVILRLHIGIIATVVLSMPLGRPLAAAEPADGVTIHINALACHELRTAADLELWVFGKPGSARAIVPNVRHERANWYWVTFILEPGDYMVSLTTTGCGDNFDLTVLPGKARTVASFMHKGGLLYHNRGSISGALPFSAVNIFARCDAEGSDPLRDIPAVIDGGAYYLNNLPDCSYHLFASLAFAQIKFSLHKDISVTRQFQHHIFDISLDMVNAAAKAALPPGVRL